MQKTRSAMSHSKGAARADRGSATRDGTEAPTFRASSHVPRGPGGYGDYDEDAWYRERDERRRSGPFGGYTDDESVRARFSPGERQGSVPGIHEVPGPSYRGIGPRSYRRSDERIYEDVCEALTDDEAVDASDVEVAVQAGVVVLNGSVPDRRMKALAEGIAYGCRGVRDVQNELRIEAGSVAEGASETSREGQP